MSDQEISPERTADYRKYPKGPNFKLIVALACVVLLLGMVAAYFFLRSDARRVVPHQANPEPNSLNRPPPAASLGTRAA